MAGAVIYEMEKLSGVRRESGAMNLKKLSGRTLAILREHMRGKPSWELARDFGMTDSSISRILNDPLSREFINSQVAQCDGDFKALYRRAVIAMANGLSSADENTALRAADMYLRAHGKYAREDAERPLTATEVAKALLEQSKVVNITQVNQYGDYGSAGREAGPTSGPTSDRSSASGASDQPVSSPDPAQ